MDYNRIWEQREQLNELPDKELNCGATTHEACLFEVECLKGLQEYVLPKEKDECSNKEMVDVIISIVMKKKGREAEAAMRLLADAYMTKLDQHAAMMRKMNGILSRISPDDLKEIIDNI